MTPVICAINWNGVNCEGDRYLRDELEELVHHNVIFLAAPLLDRVEQIDVPHVCVCTVLSLEVGPLVYTR